MESVPRTLLAVAALVLFVKCAGRFGFRKTLQWAALLIISLFPLSLAGGFIARPLQFLWNAAGAGERFAVVGAAVAGAVVTVKRFGVGTALAYLLQIAMFVAFLVLVGAGLVLVMIGSSHG